MKAMPPIDAKLDLAAGTISGFDINYHDIKIIAIDWEDKPISDAWRHVAQDDETRVRLLNWGINNVVRLPDAQAARLVAVDNPVISVEAWKRTGDNVGRCNSILLCLKNNGDTAAGGTIKLDLAGLDVNVRQVWSEFTGAVSMDGGSVENRENAEQRRGASISFNAYDGELYYRIDAGKTHVFSIDRY